MKTITPQVREFIGYLQTALNNTPSSIDRGTLQQTIDLLSRVKTLSNDPTIPDNLRKHADHIQFQRKAVMRLGDDNTKYPPAHLEPYTPDDIKAANLSSSLYLFAAALDCRKGDQQYPYLNSALLILRDSLWVGDNPATIS